MVPVEVALSVLLGLLVRWAVTLFPYSGSGKPPLFGDYEAQRHWQEITFNLPIRDWYVNGTKNDLMYWGLDYPPLTAYHSWLLGAVASRINVSWVALESSRGTESYEHKLFMRQTVLAADLLTYIPAAVFFVILQKKSSNADGQARQELGGSLVTLLLYPGLILIDYGHFQYNGVALGLTLAAVGFLVGGRQLLGAVSFALALNYKQMSLYHALPFFFYLLGQCWNPSSRREHPLWKLTKIAFVTAAAFGTCWLPLLLYGGTDSVAAAVRRLFPFERGLYEDKVANFWCSLSVFVKLKQLLTVDHLIKLCGASTLLALMPSSYLLFKRPTTDNLLVALAISSLGFFLFSFQVHEKSILLAALPISLMTEQQPLAGIWFAVVSIFSMLPLLIKDGLLVPCIAVTCIFTIISSNVYYDRLRQALQQQLLTVVVVTSLIGVILLTLCSALVRAPPRYPDLWPVLGSVYAFCHFLGYFLYFNHVLLSADRQLRRAAESKKTT